MMARIRARLAKILERLTSDKAQLAKARRRYKASRLRAKGFHDAQIKAQKAADHARARGGYYIGVSEMQDALARKEGRRAHKAQDKAIYWRGKIKLCVQRIEHLETSQAALQAKADKYAKEHNLQFHVDLNKVTGGTKRQRLLGAAHLSAARCSKGLRKNFYSQAGAFDVEHCLTGPPYEHRDDCSSWETSCHWTAGLPDPNAEHFKAGYTGTMTRTGREVSRSELKGSEAVFYGEYPYHHTEMVDDPAKETTIGHGSAPVDPGIIDLFGPDEKMTFWSYV